MVGRIGEIDEHQVVDRVIGFQPDKCVAIDYRDAAVVEGAGVELPQQGIGAEQVRHAAVEIDQGDAFDVRVLEHFARGHAVAAAQDEHAPGARQGRKGRVYQRLVIAVFVARGELQVAVEEQANVVAPARDDNALV